MNPCTVVVVLRDRFSTTENCLETLIKYTPGSHDVLAVIGGAPDDLQKKWTARFGDRIRWHFEPRFLNPSESRNIGLREVRTPLAVLMDNDVFVRPGWIEPLMQCQAETGASMVVPIVLDEEDEIHTAGNDLYITYKGSKAYGCKELRYGTLRYFEGCALKREKTDYGELHCQLVVVETALKHGVYDEKLREVSEVDSGLTWAKAGCSMWFEPRSVVYFKYPKLIDRAEDIPSYLFKWDTRAIVDSYRYFEQKWNMDITEGGRWPEFLILLNSKLGFFPRALPNRLGICLDSGYRAVRSAFRSPTLLWRSVKTRLLGQAAWNHKPLK